MSKKDIKIAVRYIVIFYFLYLSWNMTRPEYMDNLKDYSEILLSVIYGSVFGTLGWIVKSNWTTTPDKE